MNIQRVFVGYDPVETISWMVLAHSILRRTSVPTVIGPVGNGILPRSLWWRERGPHDTTEFSNARFAVPELAGYKGWALFVDADMLCLGDISEVFEQADPQYAVMVVKHDMRVNEDKTKGLGWKQTKYARKNWSSMMLFNCEHIAFTHGWIDYINRAPGLNLHQFVWLHDEEIGEIKGPWNTLITSGIADDESKLPHYTLGGPWFGYCSYAYSLAWASELEDMMCGTNPCATINATLTRRGLTIGGAYHAEAIRSDSGSTDGGRQTQESSATDRGSDVQQASQEENGRASS